MHSYSVWGRRLCGDRGRRIVVRDIIIPFLCLVFSAISAIFRSEDTNYDGRDKQEQDSHGKTNVMQKICWVALLVRVG
jgi:hypothetical protein